MISYGGPARADLTWDEINGVNLQDIVLIIVEHLGILTANFLELSLFCQIGGLGSVSGEMVDGSDQR